MLSIVLCVFLLFTEAEGGYAVIECHHIITMEDFLAVVSSPHVHVGNPCVVCALYNIFVALNHRDKQGGCCAYFVEDCS